METNTIPPNSPELRAAGEEDRLASQVLEIIGGITIEAFKTREEPEDRDAWSMEEGDDSVFYSDEEHQLGKAATSYDTDANKCKQLVNSELAGERIQQREEGAEDAVQEKSEMEKETAQDVIRTEEEHQNTPKTEKVHESNPGDAGEDLTPEKFGDFLQTNCTTADMQRQAEQNVSAEKASQAPKTPNLFDEQSPLRLNVETEQPPSPQLQVSGGRRDEQDFHIPAGFHQSPSPGYSTLPLPKKSDCGGGNHQNSFDHLTSGKYSTVSYRRICRGNTRQKIKEFEFLMKQ